MKAISRLVIMILASMLAAASTGCPRQDKSKESEKGLEVQIDTGKTKVKVDGGKTPDEKGGHFDVNVQQDRSPGKASGDRQR